MTTPTPTTAVGATRRPPTPHTTARITSPAPAMSSGPARGPVDGPALVGLVEPAPVAGMQAQGDLVVLPWPSDTDPRGRGAWVRAARQLPRSSWVRLLGSHLVFTESGPPIWWVPARRTSRATLCVVVVPDGAVCRIGHDEHADLRLAPGVYVLRRQRIHTSPHTDPAWVDD
jgi:hypothetical protein